MKDEFDSLLTEALALERTKDLDDFEKLEFDASLPAEPPVPRGFTKRLSFAIVIAAAFALISTAQRLAQAGMSFIYKPKMMK